MNKRQRKKRDKKASTEVFWRLLISMAQGMVMIKDPEFWVRKGNQCGKTGGGELAEETIKELYLENAELMDEIAMMEQNNEQQD